MKKSILAVISLLLLNTVNCQTSDTLRYPIVGELCPEFVIRNVSNFSSKESKKSQSISISELYGKWTILDFWNKTCVSCIASFPKMNRLYQKLKNRINYIQIGVEDREGEIQPQFLKYKEKLALIFPYAFDSLLCQRLDIYAGPHILIIDDKGIVKAVTNSISESQLDSLLNGNQPKLSKSYYRSSIEDPEGKMRRFSFDLTNPLLMYNNGGIDSEFISRSLLAKFDPDMGFKIPIRSNLDTLWNKGLIRKYGSYQITGVSLNALYELAYFGTPGTDSLNSWFWSDDKYEKSIPKPILEIKDKSAFGFDYLSGKNMFAYSLLVPKNIARNIDAVKEYLQRDLKMTFGYDARLEIRKMPYWRLILLDTTLKDKLTSKGDSTYFQNIINNYSFRAKNLTLRQFIHWFECINTSYPVINETGITGGVDISINGCLRTASFNDVRKVLQEIGMDIIQGSKNFQVLVLRDPVDRPTNDEMNIPEMISKGRMDLLSKVISALNINEFYSITIGYQPYKTTLLDIAVLLNADQFVTYLLDNNASPNLVWRYQSETPLMHAIRNGNLKIVKKLIANGAFVNNTMLLGNNWTTPISFAHEQRQVEIEAYLKSIGAK
ncbi:MAG: redoxin domain-containing protein [Sphingobacteriia bacterium]|nr:redoxin domain-containing protein [Sphingobacteriia bacterium]